MWPSQSAAKPIHCNLLHRPVSIHASARVVLLPSLVQMLCDLPGWLSLVARTDPALIGRLLTNYAKRPTRGDWPVPKYAKSANIWCIND
jgi:hypothetical protein